MTIVPTSETTLLLPEEARNGGGSSKASNGSDDTSALSLYIEMAPQNQRKPSVPYLRMAVIGVLALGLASFRQIDSMGKTARKNSQIQFRNRIADTAILSEENFDDAQREFQRFLAIRNKNPMPSAHAAGSLIVSKTTAIDNAGAREEPERGESLLYFNESSAFARVDPVKSDFFHYQRGWEAQITQALCAIATTAALLNSFKGPGFALPQDPIYVPFPWATQVDILASADTDPCVMEALGGSPSNVESIYHMGLGHAMIPPLANCFLQPNGYEAIGYPAVPNDDDEKAAMKTLIVEALQNPSSRVIYNYYRSGIGQKGGGHWSPIGGYHEPTDSFLIMDVAKYKFPMVWASWDDLWSGAATTDNCGHTLTIRDDLDWSRGMARIGKYLATRCIPGYRGFVVARHVGGEL